MASAPAGSLYIDIVTNLARLQTDMNRMKAAVGGAVGSVNNDLAAGATSSQRYLDAMERMAIKSGGAVTNLGKSGQLAGHHMTNLAAQFNDVAVGLYSGQKPMTVFIQQGMQISQIAGQAGVGLGGLAKGVGTMALNFAKAHPILLGVAAAAGLAAVGFKLLGDEIGKTAHLEEYAKGLGLTTKEIEKAGGATVTYSDMLQGLWKTISGGADVGKTFTHLKDMATDAFRFILDAAQKFAAGYYAAWVGGYRAIVLTWQRFPAVMKDLLALAANAAVAGITMMINAGIDKINMMIGGVNAFASLFGKTIAPIQHVDLGKPFAAAGGAVRQFGADVRAEFVGAYQQALGAQRGFFADVAKNSVEAARNRLKAAAVAKKADADAASSAHRAAGAAGEHAAAVSDQVDEIEKLLKSVGEQIAALDGASAAQEKINAMVAAGTIPASDMAEALKKENALRPIAAAMAGAQGEALKALQAAYVALGAAMDRSNKAEAEKAALIDAGKAEEEITRLKLELTLLGATNEQREIALAQHDIEQKNAGASAETMARLKKDAEDRIHLQHQVNDGQKQGNTLIEDQLRLLDQLINRAHAVGDSLADAFGRPGQAIGDLLVEFTTFAAKQKALQKELADARDKYGAGTDAYLQREQEMRARMATDEISHIGGVLSAARGLFKERSAGYKAVTTLEKIFSAIQLANMIKSMVMDKVVTVSSVGNSMVRGTADAAAGAAKTFSQLGAFAFPVIAAMIGVLAALGLSGLHGGGHGPTIPSAEDIQKAQGTGSVLGDSSAKSDSIARSLELVEKHTNRDLEYSSEMVKSLRSIDSAIGGLAGLIARQLGVGGGMFDTAGLGLGSSTSTSGVAKALAGIGTQLPVIGGLIGGIVKALFGTKTTISVLDQGLQFASQSVQDIVNGGLTGSAYQAVQTVKKSKFLGVSTGSKTSVSTTNTSLDDAMTSQIELLIASLRDGVVAGAKAIGIDGAEAMVDAFAVNIGRLSFKDLSGDEIEKQLQAVFGKVADDMAASVVGGLSAFQKVGEGLFETLARLARDYQVVDVALRAIGMTFGAVGASSVGARENLIDLFGGLDAFSEATNFFRENFLSEAEQMAPVIAAVQAEMDRLGLATISTKEAFKATVLGLDLTTEAGQQLYADLLQVAPGFAKVSDYLAKLNPALESSAKTAEQLAAIAKERRSLEIQLMTAEGDAAGALAAQRADEIAATDESNRALRAAIYAAQDAAEAQKALADAQAAAARVANERRGLEIRLAEATGDAATALTMKREDELAALDESNRALLTAIFAAEDAAAAQDALNQVHMTASEIAKTQRDLEIQLMEATGNAAGALAAKRADELAALDPVLHALQLSVWAAQDAAAAQEGLNAVHQTAAELAKSRHDLELRLMEVEGRDADLLAAKRADELAATDDSLKAMLAQIFAAEDAKTAQDALAAATAAAAQAAEDAAAKARAIADERHGLEIRLLEATGDAAGALALKRADELAALDETNRALLQSIFAAEDLAAAQGALNQVTQTAAEIAKTRRDLEIQLMEAQGRSAEALAARRADELAAMDATLRPLQLQVWAALDAADAQQKLADAQAEAARAAEDLAAKRGDLEIRLLRATGHEVEAVAMERARELDQLDPTLRSLALQVFAAEDLKAAMDAQSAAANDLRNRFADAAKGLREFKAGLAASAADDAAAAYRAAGGRFAGLAQRARMGDADAMNGLQSAAQDFLAASREGAASRLDYQRDVGFIAGAVDAAIRVADAQVSDADKQLAVLSRQADLLLMVNDSVMTVHDAIMEAAERGAALAGPSSAAVAADVAAGGDYDTIAAEVRGLRAEIVAPTIATAVNAKKVADKLDTWDEAGALAVVTREDDSLAVTVDGDVAVVNGSTPFEVAP